MVDVKKILEEGKGIHKFSGVAPEGFLLIHEKTLEDLKNYEIWKMWVENKLKINDLNIKYFGENK